MLDYQRIADDVRNSLSVQGMEDVDYLRAIVADFAVACEEVNERLQQCEALLRRGLRSEALHLCEIEPNLLDAVASLDFPERAQWEESLVQYNLVPPVPLNIAAAETLNEAYAFEQPMGKLLRNHRLLALSRGPLCDRISVLRRLADADSANPIWSEDVDAFERARLEQIRGEAIAAGTRGDFGAVKQLYDEVLDPSWRNPPPSHVIESVAGIHEQLLHDRLHERLKATERHLHGAFSAFDVARGRHFRAQWNELTSTPGFAASPEISNRATPALQWLEEQDRLDQRRQRHDVAVAALHQALARNHSLTKLQQCYHHATRAGEPLPGDLERRYYERVESLKRASTRRRYLVTLGVVAMVVLLAGGIRWTMGRQARSSRLAQTRENLEKLIEQDDLDSADNYRKQLEREEPESLEEPAIALVIAQLDRAIVEESRRKKEYRSAIALVEESLEGDAPESIEPDTHSLSTAERLARTDEEKGMVTKLAQRIEKNKSEVREKNIQALRADFDSLGTKVALLERRGHEKLDQYREPLQEAGSSLKHLTARAKSMGAHGLFERDDNELSEIVTKLQQWISQCEREERSLVALTRSTGDCAAYQGALREYAAQFAASPRATDFLRVAESRPVWEAVVHFSQFVERWNHEVPARLDPEKAGEYLATVQGLLRGGEGTLRDTPLGNALQQRAPLLEAIARRDSPRLRDPLQHELEQPIMRGCWCITALASGKRYFVLEEPKLKPGVNNIRFVINRAGELRSGIVRAEDAEITVAPQVLLGKEIRSILTKLDHQEWESQLYQIMEAIYRAKDVDDVLRFDLLRMTLKKASDGSYPIAKAFEKHSEVFNHSKVDLFANWMDPNCPEAQKARQLARAELNQVPSFATAWKQAEEQLATLWQPPGSPFLWAGWLRKNLQDQWEPVVNEPPSRPGDLFVFCTEGDNVESVRIGTIQGSEMVLSSIAAVPLLREGMPLFVVIAPPGQAVASN